MIGLWSLVVVPTIHRIVRYLEGTRPEVNMRDKTARLTAGRQRQARDFLSQPNTQVIKYMVIFRAGLLCFK